MDAGGLNPTVVNGGVIHAYGSNARLGRGDWTVVEADESDGSFNRLPTTVAVVTNIDPEHLDHWRDFDALREGFRRFVQGIPFYGLAVLCADHAEVRALAGRITDRRVVSYGLSEAADLRAVGLRPDGGGMRFDILRRDGPPIADCRLPIPGDHNIANALAAVAVALHLGVAPEAIRRGLAGFSGVGRRFTHLGTRHGVRVIDDYAHHPVEIAMALRAARQVAAGGRVIAVHQPHRYSRLSALFDDFCRCFGEADMVAIAEVYAAGEAPMAGAGRDDLVAGIRAAGHPSVHALADEAALEAFFRDTARPGDIFICLGAGSISAWAQGLAARLEACGGMADLADPRSRRPDRPRRGLGAGALAPSARRPVARRGAGRGCGGADPRGARGAGNGGARLRRRRAPHGAARRPRRGACRGLGPVAWPTLNPPTKMVVIRLRFFLMSCIINCMHECARVHKRRSDPTLVGSGSARRGPRAPARRWSGRSPGGTSAA
jgi:UDP-N-acetylmuramate--alanine ligase